MSSFLKQAAASFGAPPEPAAFLTLEDIKTPGLAAATAPQPADVAPRQPVMLPNAAFEQTPRPAPAMFDDDDDSEDEPVPSPATKPNGKAEIDNKVHMFPSTQSRLPVVISRSLCVYTVLGSPGSLTTSLHERQSSNEKS